jgi:hypothetical protein
MRFLAMLVGLGLMVLAGLWFFTPVLDSTYSRHVPQYANPRHAAKAPATGGAVTRGAAPEAARSARAPSSGAGGDPGGSISSKALAENVLSMVNLGAGLIGAWFTYLSYRMQVRSRRRGEDA